MYAARVDETEALALLDYEQERLWDDLNEALRMAINGVWSIGAEGKAHRVVCNVRLIGPIDSGRIAWPLYTSGIYDMLCGFAGREPIHLDQAEFERCDLMMRKHHCRPAAEEHALRAATRREVLRYRPSLTEPLPARG